MIKRQQYETLEEILVANTNVTLNCWEWDGLKLPTHYGRIQFEGKNLLAHRVAFELHHKRKIPEGMVILHTCDNPCCVNPNHLAVGTHKDNSQDMVAKGRARGATGPQLNGRKKLTKAAVKRIFHDERHVSEIMKDYGVSRSTVYGIKAGTNRPEITSNLRKKKPSTKAKTLV